MQTTHNVNYLMNKDLIILVTVSIATDGAYKVRKVTSSWGTC